MSSNSTLKRHGGGTYTAIAMSTNSASPIVMPENLNVGEGDGNE